MSVWSTEADAILAVVRTALDGALPSGTVGAELGFRDNTKLEADELPHAFLFNPRSTDNPLDFGQSEVTTTYQLEVWADDTLATLAGWRDAILEEVNADTTLGGTVVRFRLTDSGIVENQSHVEGRRVLVIQFQTFKVEG